MPRRPPKATQNGIARRFDSASQRLDRLEQPQAINLGNRITALTQLVTNLPGVITAALAVSATIGHLIVTGIADIAGMLNANGGVTSPSVFASNAGNIAGNITAARTQTWARNSDGYIGNTLSSIEFKELVEGVDGPDPLKILEFTNRYYHYIQELELEREDPDYHVQLEWGPIAQELHELGLWQVVVYSDHSEPISVHHALFGQLAIEAAKYVWQQHLELVALQKKDREDINDILQRLNS